MSETQRIVPGYEPLAEILQKALDQAQTGKGAKCHANGKPFLEQPIMEEGRNSGPGFLSGQARKKILEALNCPDDDRAITDLLGAINYVAAMVILRQEGVKRENAIIGVASAGRLMGKWTRETVYANHE
jgi:hypothetical protein